MAAVNVAIAEAGSANDFSGSVFYVPVYVGISEAANAADGSASGIYVPVPPVRQLGAAVSTIELSCGSTAAEFGAAVLAGAADATAIFDTIYGLDDGNDYGRYFFGQDPLIAFIDSATNLTDLIAQGVLLSQAVAAAAQALNAAATNTTLFPIAGFALTEALRTACANPADAVRILSDLASGFTAPLPALVDLSDAVGQQIYLLTARASFDLRLAAAASLVAATADYQPTSQEDAVTLSGNVADLLDNLYLCAADIFDDATATAIDAARVAVVEDLTARGGNLATTTTFSFGASLPAAVLAYRIYGDATRSADLVARVDPPHPGFMPLSFEALTS